jgi:uncharacterized protein YegP (UPF0339 family)
MALKNRKVQIYQSRRNGQFGWRLIAKNGQRIAVSGETYEKRKHAEKMVAELWPNDQVEYVGKNW